MDIQAIQIRRMTPDDAAGVVACFERVYAGSYPVEAFHDAAALAELLRADLQRSVVAVTRDGAVVGHMGLRLRHPGAVTADAGNTAVDPAARGHSIAAGLGFALMQLAVQTGLVGTHGYPTTAHPVIQKLEVEGGAFETGILYDYIPADTRYVGIEGVSAARLAVVVVYRPLAATGERVVHLPVRHVELARELYGKMGLSRIVHLDGEQPSAKASKLVARTEARRGLVRIEVETVGRDLQPRVEEIAGRSPSMPFLVDLPLGNTGAGWASEALASCGFFYGALLPEHDGQGDVLRLQRRGQDGPLPKPATPGGQALLGYVEADRAPRRDPRPGRN